MKCYPVARDTTPETWIACDNFLLPPLVCWLYRSALGRRSVCCKEWFPQGRYGMISPWYVRNDFPMGSKGWFFSEENQRRQSRATQPDDSWHYWNFHRHLPRRQCFLAAAGHETSVRLRHTESRFVSFRAVDTKSTTLRLGPAEI